MSQLSPAEPNFQGWNWMQAAFSLHIMFGAQSFPNTYAVVHTEHPPSLPYVSSCMIPWTEMRLAGLKCCIKMLVIKYSWTKICCVFDFKLLLHLISVLWYGVVKQQLLFISISSVFQCAKKIHVAQGNWKCFTVWKEISGEGLLLIHFMSGGCLESSWALVS